MNCQAVQNQILHLPDPRELSAALREHVRGCAACQAWARQAARLEGILEHLPVPPAPGEKKEAMIGDLMSADPVILPMATPATRPGFGLVAVRLLRRNLTYVGGLAAAVMVAVAAVALWPKSTTQPKPEVVWKDPFAEKLVARDVALARADNPAKRIDALNGMADDIATEARGMARLASGAELRQMAGWYEKVVKDGLVRQAETLPVMGAPEKAKLLEPIAARLDADAAEAERLSREAPQDAQPALKRMADAAREGGKSLRDAARGGK
jgi:hypothetical protein